MKNKRITIFLGVAAGLLSIPLIAMQFSDEVNWSAFDFAVMGGLLLFVCLFLEFALQVLKDTKRRLIAIVFILLVFLFVWAELAVGIVGSPFAGS